MNFISPVNHPESELSGSTIQSMIDRTKELGLSHFACTDQDSLLGIISGYNYAKKKDVKFIAGVELFFKDPGCEIVSETPSQMFKYSKVVVHARDQEAYQMLVRLVSENHRPVARVNGNNHSLYTWSDLERISKYNVTVCTANVEDMVTKHLLVDRQDLAEAHFVKLIEIFGDKYYPCILPFNQDKYWTSTMSITAGDTVFNLPANAPIETDKYKFSKAGELAKRGRGGHKKLLAVTVNGIRYKIKPECQELGKCSMINEFKDMEDVQVKANKFILEMAKKHGCQTNLLISSYSYYSRAGDKVVQDMKLGDEKRQYQAQYIMTNEDVLPFFEKSGLTKTHLEVMTNNSHRWASLFDDFKLDYDYRLPVPEGDPKKLLMERIEEMGRMNWDDPVYVKQFREEFELLTGNEVIDLIPYFLPIVDIYDFYAKNGYLTGPARGSAGGFLISYLIGITHVDPIKYELSSSRFLTLDRVQQGNLPDIDCDLEDRGPLVGPDGNGGYLFNKYGKQAAQVSTRTLLRIKSAILDANRFKNGGKVEAEVSALAKSLPNTPQGVNDSEYVFGYEKDGTHVDGLIDLNDDLKAYVEKRPEEWDIVSRALSLSRQNSRHACAFVISDADIEDTVPIMEVGGVTRVTQPTHKDCEAAGLIKYDFLVVSALKDINLCLKYINKKNKVKKQANYDNLIGWVHHESDESCCSDCDPNIEETVKSGAVEPIFQGMESYEQAYARHCSKCGKKHDTVDYTDVSYKETGYFSHKGEKTYVWDLPVDSEVFQMLWQGKTETVFQLHSSTATPLVMDIRPESVVDCAVITSLGRPGPLDFTDKNTGRNMAEEYAWRKRGESKGDIPILDALLPGTYGILVFQEQVTKLAKELAGMSVIDAENVRIAVGKKKKKLIDSLKPVFIEGASKKVDVETATKIWDMMETFARYGFNKSHAVAYSVISYACAFLKHHYPLEWWAAVLSNAPDKEINENFYKYVKDMVMPPDVNTSTEQMEVDYDRDKIRNKLSVISGLGKKLAEKIMAGRPYQNLDDFVATSGCGQAMGLKLAYVGVLDSLFPPGLEDLTKISMYLDSVAKLEHSKKMQEKIDKIQAAMEAEDEKQTKSIRKQIERLNEKGPKNNQVP